MVVVVVAVVRTRVGTLVGTRVVPGVVGPPRVVVVGRVGVASPNWVVVWVEGVGEVGRRQVGTTPVRFDSRPWCVSVLVLDRVVLRWE